MDPLLFKTLAMDSYKFGDTILISLPGAAIA